ncbi:MAG: PLP-dependent aminotransferase family protein [Oceanospirillaceae bacterium]|nr:PLP-dependent aminotransferase family protein [Oceanospirillaceae bacterium]
MPKFLYHQLAEQLRANIKSGQLAPLSQLPSVRIACRDTKLSKSTVLAAYAQLEAQGLIESRPRSGYYVRPLVGDADTELKRPATSSPSVSPRLISRSQVIIDIMRRGAAFDLLIDNEAVTHNEQLRRCLSSALRRQNSQQQLYYDQPQGDQSLRVQLAQHINLGGGQCSAEDVVISSGCQHSLLLALMATTAPGDLVAIESPSFYGALELLEVLGRQVLEIPSSAITGISPQALAQACVQWDIKALLVSPSFATPTGACMPDTHKLQILQLAQANQFAIIEDDIYAQLHFSLQRPRTIYSFDDSGCVLLCSSLSKSLSRDLRLGWIAAGSYTEKIMRLKIATSMATGISLQQGVSLFIAQGGLDKHLKQRRLQLRLQHDQLQSLIRQYLPQAVSASQPTGGLVLWLELDQNLNTLKLYHQARALGLAITPGGIFSAQERYQNFLRISFAHPWTERRIQAFMHLAKLIKESSQG